MIQWKDVSEIGCDRTQPISANSFQPISIAVQGAVELCNWLSEHGFGHSAAEYLVCGVQFAHRESDIRDKGAAARLSIDAPRQPLPSRCLRTPEQPLW